MKKFKRKARVATILGTLQATLTNFRYLRKKWQQNCEEERLLGVSMTGIMDNELTNGHRGFDRLKSTLDSLREYTIEVNKEWSQELGIEQSTAIQCVKPSGTVSQLTDTASGIHPRFSQYYLRTIRADRKDPLAHFMIDKGFYYENDKMSDSNYVFYFPVKAPEGCVTADDMGAISQMELWEVYQDHWCEHKPSMTCYYTDDEFLALGQWVWDRLDKISGVSFLPVVEHTYQQAPYQAVDKETYEEWLASMPKNVDWSELGLYEEEDRTEGSQEFACSGGSCEL